MPKRLVNVVFLAVTSVVVIGCFYFLLSKNSVDSSNRSVWLGPKVIELEAECFPLDYQNGIRLLAPASDATEVVSLYGTYDNGSAEENVLIEKLANEIRVRAWWVTPSGDAWLIDANLSASDFEQLWKTLNDHRAFELKDESRRMSHAMKYWLTIKKDGRENEASVYGVGWHSSTTISGDAAQISPEWHHVVRAILDLRATMAHQVRPAGFAGRGSGVFTAKTTGEVLVDEIAARQVDIMKRAESQQELTWNAVLDIGYYRNREIVTMVVTLLDSPNVEVASAACAVMSWVSGETPNADREHWRQWWDENATTYRPIASSVIEGAFGNGVISNLGGYAKGFLEVENDDDGNVWALVETQRSWDKRTYRLYTLDRQSEKFVQTTSSRSYGSKSDMPPPVRFFRRVAETGINFPSYHNGVWVSPTGKWGAAILGHQSEYHSDSVVLLDFENGRMQRPFRTDHQYASPVVSSDGAYVAVAKAWSWADPNSAVVIDTATGKEQLVPISPAGNFGPIAFVANSTHGAGFYLVRRDDGDDPGTLWWCSPNGSQAKQLLTLPRGLTFRMHGDVNVTVDGARIFSSRPTVDGQARESGWLHVVDGTFEPVIPPSAWPTSVDVTSDGSRVVFIDGRKVYQWQRSTGRADEESDPEA